MQYSRRRKKILLKRFAILTLVCIALFAVMSERKIDSERYVDNMYIEDITYEPVIKSSIPPGSTKTPNSPQKSSRPVTKFPKTTVPRVSDDDNNNNKTNRPAQNSLQPNSTSDSSVIINSLRPTSQPGNTVVSNSPTPTGAPVNKDDNHIIYVETPKPTSTPNVSESIIENKVEVVKEYPGMKIKLVPGFETVSYYFSCKNNYQACVFYKEIGSNYWKICDTPVYSNNEYRGSIVGLLEGKKYEIKIELFDNNEVKYRNESTFTTKESDVKIAKTIRLSELIESNTIDGLYIKNIKGTKNGYIRIIGDVAIDSAGKGDRYQFFDQVDSDNLLIKENVQFDYAFTIYGCEYVIFEGFNVKGGKTAAVTIYGESENVFLRNFDISEFGYDPVYVNGIPSDSSNKPMSVVVGLEIANSRDIVFEKSIIHNPKTKANCWNATFDSSSHPRGNSGIYIMNSLGRITIRDNSITGSSSNWLMDGIEGWKNSSYEGGIKEDSDIYNNYFSYINDDAIELDGAQKNIRVYGNTFEKCLSGVSVSPNYEGPSYIFRNQFINMRDYEGNNTQCIKTVWNSSISNPGKTFVYHNTFCTSGSIFAVYSTHNYAACIVSRNNCIYIYGKGYGINNQVNILEHNYDNDLVFVRNNIDHTVRMKGLYEANGVFVNPLFVDYENSKLKLQAGSPAIDRAVLIYNFNDEYIGKGPDIGAYECY